MAHRWTFVEARNFPQGTVRPDRVDTSFRPALAFVVVIHNLDMCLKLAPSFRALRALVATASEGELND